ncbi:MAG: hypothetical protein M1818_005983 [Claussenomyces sp. TS43310]|nr:MAG: hypothetical protein M1818_005983 [Claussenomyces sp. TS43310]
MSRQLANRKVLSKGITSHRVSVSENCKGESNSASFLVRPKIAPQLRVPKAWNWPSLQHIEASELSPPKAIDSSYTRTISSNFYGSSSLTARTTPHVWQSKLKETEATVSLKLQPRELRPTIAVTSGVQRHPLAHADFISHNASSSQMRRFSSSSRTFSSPQSQPSIADLEPSNVVLDTHETVHLEEQGIRERLRRWEIENVDRSLPTIEQVDVSKKGGVSNSYSRITTSETIVEVAEEFDTEGFAPLFEKGELVDFGDQRSFLVRGDMVELRSGTRVELAIFIRNLQFQSQFYTMSGRWIHQRSQTVKFFVPNFVEPEQVDALLPFLPDADVPDDLQSKLQTFEFALPRNIGRPMVRKMLAFWNESDAAYRISAFRLDNAHKLVASDTELRYATLEELGHELIPSSMISRNVPLPAPTLYAVHRKLMHDDIGFRAQRRAQRVGNHRAWGSYEISPLVEIDIISRVAMTVRKYQEYLVARNRASKPPSACAGFFKFIHKVQKLIKRSRRVREFTPYGMVSPARAVISGSEEVSPVHLDQEFDGNDNNYIRFMESWCGLRNFGADSPVHGIGSAILRATGLYSNVPLDYTTGWTFLQEIGAIAPWADQAAFDARLPNTGRMLRREGNLGNLLLRPDVMQGLRRDWGDLPVYCIDDTGAEEIDDGVSLERTDTPDEYWIHVHAADPSSQIAPDSEMGMEARSRVQTVYLPERKVSMLNERIVRERFSLAARRPCLTFSARMNSNGDILENRVTPGIINNVKYITPAVLDVVLGYKRVTEESILTVGHEPTDTAGPVRQMLSVEQVLDSDKETFQTLYLVSKARAYQNALRGAVTINIGNQGNDVSVHFNEHTYLDPRFQKPSTSYLYHDDPTIKLKVPSTMSTTTPGASSTLAAKASDTVKGLMLIAGEVAAQWCSQRGVPVVYRGTHSHPDSDDAGLFFRQNILPSVLAGIDPTEDNTRTYMRLLGGVVASTRPGPHIALGVEKYTKSTSPLRRFSDLLLHWQIEAALLEEARLGKSLVGNSREDFLPFTTAEVDAMIPRMDDREKQLHLAQDAAARTWVMQLLIRAWKFGEAKLPETFEFVAKSVKMDQVSGSIPSLGDFRAVFEIPAWMQPETLKVEDVFEVRINDLNSYTRRASFVVLRRIRAAAEVM